MNELLQQHGCSNVFTVPEGLKELMSDITREVLRDQPSRIFDFIANYLSVLLITREHGVLAMKILDELCDCKPTVEEHLQHIGVSKSQAELLAEIIKQEIEGFEPSDGKEKLREIQIMKKVLSSNTLDEVTTGKICQIVRNAYRDYWYRKKLMEKSVSTELHETWELAAEHTLEIYKRTKPSFSELSLATLKIQAAYRGFYVRKNLLRHLKPKMKKPAPKVDLPGPPLDIASSREIDLGPKIEINVHEDDVGVMFEEDANEKLGLRYNTMKTITHVEEKQSAGEQTESIDSKSAPGQIQSQNSARGRAESVAFETLSHSEIPTRHSHTEESRGSMNQPLQSPMSTQHIENLSTNKIHKVSLIVEEVQDESGIYGQEYTERTEDDTATEIPEEIMDEMHGASAPSSAPETDIEITSDVDTEEEDGE